ncbi:hypothetical protein CGCF415_v012366 [Colletotrichum fructicola]|uniref:Uncharacterized protein n=1 Tax=Colletotrichum fructicola (strain Nara gc5) TaxID=1213859 RepID=A0A7J6ILJ8_COLFN|nr:hypothetical protein CGGC5_v014483 [Colletotrichum fructicola Nara gc5]KAF4886925.1 hypothetical protein CGCFRS4_v010845 [Colletotrichum fructicola]KAF4894109.1 hypothetical protein CGCF415_v012366 [Colletotrichum fructicola]KAF4929033.1 hypothetical protein CGCF245_v012322 [Colletotrichum fructicola]
MRSRSDGSGVGLSAVDNDEESRAGQGEWAKTPGFADGRTHLRNLLIFLSSLVSSTAELSVSAKGSSPAVCANPKAIIYELSVISASWKRNPGFRSVERGRYPQFCAARITGAERPVFRSTIRKLRRIVIPSSAHFSLDLG